jgi:enoyl-[acyl-carrier protein] reductase I
MDTVTEERKAATGRGLLEGKKALVMGVANKRSIAWGIAAAFQREGAQLAFTHPGDPRLLENVNELVRTLPDADHVPVLQCDVSSDEQITGTFREIADRWGSLDVLVHSIAFAPIEELRGKFSDVSRKGLLDAISVSAYSLLAITRAALPLFEKAGGGSVMSMTFNAVDRVVPSYNAMAIAKAVLEAETRYLAVELGEKNVRVNAISAGPLKTLAASAVKGISQARDLMEAKSPLRRNVTQEEIGNVAVFLASDWSRAVTGATIFADNGMNIVGVTE